MTAPSGQDVLSDCPACHGTGTVTGQEYDEIVAAMAALEDSGR